MKHSERPIVACVPVEEAKHIMPSFPASATYSTYEKVPCPECRRAMWIGERGKKEVEEGRASMACMRCLVTAGYIQPRGQVIPLHQQ